MAPLTRLSPLRDWITRPAARARIERPLSELQGQLFGAAAETPKSESGAGELANSFLTDMPIAKLVMLGLLSERELAQLIETVNTVEVH
jgi:hypothetical protein